MNRLTISQFNFLPFNNSNTHKIEKEMELEILSFVLLEMKNCFYRNTSEFSLCSFLLKMTLFKYSLGKKYT